MVWDRLQWDDVVWIGWQLDDLVLDRLAVRRRGMGQVGCGTTWYGTG